MMSQIDSWHWTISTGRHFQNGSHNTANIQHCPISTSFHMWVDYDVPNWFPTSKNFYRSPFSKWPPQYRTNSTLSDFNDISYVGRLWTISTGRHFQNGRHNTANIQHCPISTSFDMWVDYDVPNWFPTSKNFYRSPFSKWPPQYRTNSTLSDFNDISYVGRLWCPEMIPDIEKFLPVAIFKMAATILHKFNIVRFQR
jgi:hypothetical protein